MPDIAAERGLRRIEHEAWLLGQPSLQKYLDFVEDMVPGGSALSRTALADEWRAANDYYYDLEQSEAGIADEIEIKELDPALRPLAEQVAADARYRRAYDTLPTRFAMVELDRLVVSQRHVNLDHVERSKARLGRSPVAEDIFHFCLPLASPDAKVEMRRLGSRRFMFWSASSDFRFHEPALLGPHQISGYDAYGPLGGVIGLMVGFGSNFLNVIQDENRVLLHNGQHRAFALRELGVTHAPCIVQTVTRKDELNLVASREVVESPAYYFKSDRPPLLKDFFDPRIRKTLKVEKILRVIELSFEVKDFEVRDFELTR